MTALEPLEPEDLRILRLESPTVAGHTCKVAIFDRVPHAPPLELFRERVATRIARVPRCVRCFPRYGRFDSSGCSSRMSASPGMARATVQATFGIDVRPVLPMICAYARDPRHRRRCSRPGGRSGRGRPARSSGNLQPVAPGGLGNDSASPCGAIRHRGGVACATRYPQVSATEAHALLSTTEAQPRAWRTGSGRRRDGAGRGRRCRP